MKSGEKEVVKYAIFASLIWLVGTLIVHHATERSRFEAKLSLALRELHQKGETAESLTPLNRAELLQKLNSSKAIRRWQAANELAIWKDQTSVSALVIAMQDGQGTERTCVIAQSLGKIGSSEAVPALVQAINHVQNLDLRVCATHALTDIGDPRAVQPLIEKAKDRSTLQDDYASAIIALGDLGFPQALPALSEIVEHDPDRKIRAVALAAIRRIEIVQSDDPVAALLSALRKPVPWIHAEWILKELARRWEPRVADALNGYLSSGAHRAGHCIQVAALLIYHRAMRPWTIQVLAKSGKRQHIWLADYVSTSESSRLVTRVQEIKSISTQQEEYN
jgi:hypothetical protein